MRIFLLSWVLLSGLGNASPKVSTTEPCSCTKNQRLAMDLYEKGDLQAFLTFKSCDNTYDPRSDQYDFWRRASMSCTLKELLDDPLQTQTANGND